MCWLAYTAGVRSSGVRDLRTMSRFLSLLTSIGGKKYAPPPPEIDYRPSEIYRVDPAAGFRSDDADASLSSEYCDPEDVIRGHGRIDSDSEYSVPCEGPDGIYYSAVAGHPGHDDGLPDGASGHPDQLYRQWSDDRCSSFASCTDGSPGILVAKGQLQQQPQWPPHDDPSRGHSSGHDNEDYDCPWDTGILESEVYRMMKERAPSCTQSEMEQDQSQQTTGRVSNSQASEGALGSPAAGGLKAASELDSHSESPVYSDACHDGGQPLSFANTGYFIPDSGPSEVRATVFSPTAAKADCRKPLAVPRDRIKRESGGSYVNHRLPIQSPSQAPPPPPQALPPPSPASSSAPRLPSTGDDPLAGTYDDPWDLRQLEETLASKEDELCRAAAAAKTDFGAAGSVQGRGGPDACGKRISFEPVPEATTRVDGSSPLTPRSILNVSAAFSGGAKTPAPPSSLLLLQRTISSSSSEQDSGGSGVGGGAVPRQQQQQPAASASNSRKPNSPVARPLPAAAAGSSGLAPIISSPMMSRSIVSSTDRDSPAPSSRQLQQPQSTAAAAAPGPAPKVGAVGGGIGSSKLATAGAAASYDSIAKELSEVLAQKSLGAPVGAPAAPVKKPDLASGAWRNAANGKSDVTAPAGVTFPALPAVPVPATAKSATDQRPVGRTAASAAAAAATATAGASSAAAAAGYDARGCAGAVASSVDKTPAVGQPTAATAEKKRPLLPLKQQRWFHGDITRQQAEELLVDEPVGSFLVRVSSTGNQDYSLSLRVPSLGAIHLKITFADGQYVLGQFSQPFNSITEMIDHYSNNPITIRHAEHVKLQKGVSRLQQ